MLDNLETKDRLYLQQGSAIPQWMEKKLMQQSLPSIYKIEAWSVDGTIYKIEAWSVDGKEISATKPTFNLQDWSLIFALFFLA
jgi:hypothetical protein